MKKLLFLLLACSTLSSCKVLFSLSEMNRSTAKLHHYQYQDKSIIFLPMHHLGKKSFYDDVGKKVTALKAEGYRVYYELVDTKKNSLDSTEKLTLRRKVRRIMGFSGSYKEALQGSFFKKYVQQPEYKDMGVTDTDLRADISHIEFVKEVERLHGAIVLDSIDIHTPFDATYPRDPLLTRHSLSEVAIKYRNQHLVNTIKSKHDKRILILYGAGHRKDFKKRLRQP